MRNLQGALDHSIMVRRQPGDDGRLHFIFKKGMRMKAFLLALVLAAVQISALAFGQTASNPGTVTGGKLRCGMIAIRVLGGVAQPVCKFFADQLGVALEPVMYTSPDAYAQSFGKGEWDVAVGPTVLAPTEKADVTVDLWLIPLIYVAAPGHEFANASEVDRAGVKIGTIQGSPSDRYLSHNVKSAELVRIPLSQHISADVADLLKIIPGAFNTVRIAAALLKGRSELAQKKLADLVSDAKRTGVVQKAIEQQGLKGVRVAD
jgi:polar amino acid transport system substrate-binding protein